MKKLERGEMKNLKGGVGDSSSPSYVPLLIGWRGGASVGFCFCDFYNIASPNRVSCDNPCPVSMCTVGSLDPNRASFSW